MLILCSYGFGFGGFGDTNSEKTNVITNQYIRTIKDRITSKSLPIAQNLIIYHVNLLFIMQSSLKFNLSSNSISLSETFVIFFARVLGTFPSG